MTVPSTTTVSILPPQASSPKETINMNNLALILNKSITVSTTTSSTNDDLNLESPSLTSSGGEACEVNNVNVNVNNNNNITSSGAEVIANFLSRKLENGEWDADCCSAYPAEGEEKYCSAFEEIDQYSDINGVANYAMGYNNCNNQYHHHDGTGTFTSQIPNLYNMSNSMSNMTSNLGSELSGLGGYSNSGNSLNAYNSFNQMSAQGHMNQYHNQGLSFQNTVGHNHGGSMSVDNHSYMAQQFMNSLGGGVTVMSNQMNQNLVQNQMNQNQMNQNLVHHPAMSMTNQIIQAPAPNSTKQSKKSCSNGVYSAAAQAPSIYQMSLEPTEMVHNVGNQNHQNQILNAMSNQNMPANTTNISQSIQSNLSLNQNLTNQNQNTVHLSTTSPGSSLIGTNMTMSNTVTGLASSPDTNSNLNCTLTSNSMGTTKTRRQTPLIGPHCSGSNSIPLGSNCNSTLATIKPNKSHVTSKFTKNRRETPLIIH